MIHPKSAIIAVTLNCNSRCIMCDIWKNRIKNELQPKEYLKLPSSLTDINITGGEPFLRRDIVDIIKNMKIAAPHARLVLNTNGFLPDKIGRDMKKILALDPKFAFRVSIDGIGKKHDKVRRIPGGFDKIIKTLDVVGHLGAQNVGVSFTLGNYNMDELPKVQNFCISRKLEFSLTIATGSSIYFGKEKGTYRPNNTTKLIPLLEESAQKHLKSMSPKEILRGWFVKRLLNYAITGKRTLPCDAGRGFFYMDSVGNVYTCHIKPWIMGNIRKQSMESILTNTHWASSVSACNDCWMVCTAKSMMKQQLFRVAIEALGDKIASSIASS